MSEMVERATHAILDVPVPQGSRGLTKGEAREFVAAIIKAMREPTPEMIEAGSHCPIVNYDGNDPKEVWQTMIDEAVK